VVQFSGGRSVTDAVPLNFQPSGQNQLVKLSISSFVSKIGWTVFSTHDGTLTLTVEARGKTTVIQTVTGSGSDSSGSYLKTYGALLLPTVGVSGYNEAMSVMLTNTAAAASAEALKVAQQCGG